MGYNTGAMQTYDLLVYLDQDGDPILEHNSIKGKYYCDKLARALVHPTDTMVIQSTPEEFLAGVPKDLSVGFRDSTGMIKKLCPPLLH